MYMNKKKDLYYTLTISRDPYQTPSHFSSTIARTFTPFFPSKHTFHQLLKLDESCYYSLSAYCTFCSIYGYILLEYGTFFCFSFLSLYLFSLQFFLPLSLFFTRIIFSFHFVSFFLVLMLYFMFSSFNFCFYFIRLFHSNNTPF